MPPLVTLLTTPESLHLAMSADMLGLLPVIDALQLAERRTQGGIGKDPLM